MNNFSLPVALAADDDENCSWMLAMGMINPLTLQFLWDHHFMIKSYFNLKLCILCKIYLDMSTENSGKRTLKMLSTFN